MRYLCLDLGRRRIGVAISDPDGLLARPLTTIHVKSTNDTIANVLRLLTEQGAGALVIGLPLQLNGEEGIEAGRARAFAAKLAAQTVAPITMWDERLTSVVADRMLLDSGVRTQKKRQQIIDQTAAAVILQSYLDSRRPTVLLPPDLSSEYS